MNYPNTLHPRAFTLIELLIVITIMGIITVSTYIPYAHHQKKVLLQQWAREISQSLRDARNLAINGLNTGSWNVSVGLYFGSWASQIEYFTYPYGESLVLTDIGALEAYRSKDLPKWIQLEEIDGVTTGTLFTFEAISGAWSFEPQTWSGEMVISVSFRWSTESVLRKEIVYYPQSYISDY